MAKLKAFLVKHIFLAVAFAAVLGATVLYIPIRKLIAKVKPNALPPGART